MSFLEIESLKEWKDRVKEECKLIREELMDVELGSDKDVALSGKLGSKGSLIEGIEDEINRVQRRIDNSRERSDCE